MESTKQKNAELILDFVNANKTTNNAEVVEKLKIGRESARLILIELVKAGKINCTVDGQKKIYEAIVEKTQAAPRLKRSKTLVASQPILTEDMKKSMPKLGPKAPIKIKDGVKYIVETSSGTGILEGNTNIIVKNTSTYESTEKLIVILVDENFNPLMHNKKPKKILVAKDKISIVRAIVPEKAKKAKKERIKGEKSESVKDFTRYVLDGVTYNKSRLVQAVIAKYVKKHNPTFAELSEAFPEKEIQPSGELFKNFDEIIKSAKQNRFFAKDEEKLVINDCSIAVTNQMNKDIIARFISCVEAKHAKMFKITVANV